MLKSNLENIINERGIKQTWLADKSGVNKATLSNIIRKRHDPSLEVAIRISLALNLEIKDIWEFESDI